MNRGSVAEWHRTDRTVRYGGDSLLGGCGMAVHAYTAAAVREAVEAEVKVIEHGNQMDVTPRA